MAGSRIWGLCVMIDLTPKVETVAVTREDGGVTVLRFVVEEYQKVRTLDDTIERAVVHKPLTDERVEASIAKRYEPIPGHPSGIWNGGNGKRHVSWRRVANDYVDENTDRTYRNAWKDAPGRTKPDHDMVKARNLHRDILRRDRQPQLDNLDIQYVQADERNDRQAKATIAAQKQKIRDVTADPRIESAQTVDQLKALTLDALIA